MVRGRAGGGGAAFNLGEMTVTRCTVRTETGFVGHAYIAGPRRTVRRTGRAGRRAHAGSPIARRTSKAASSPVGTSANRQNTPPDREGRGNTRAILRHADDADLRRRNTLSPGFADPVTDAQACFRAVLDAMARPDVSTRCAPSQLPPPLVHAAAARAADPGRSRNTALARTPTAAPLANLDHLPHRRADCLAATRPCSPWPCRCPTLPNYQAAPMRRRKPPPPSSCKSHP